MVTALAQDAEVVLRVTVAHHGDNEFYDLGPVTHEVPPAVLFEQLPEAACVRDDDGNATHPDFCIVVDVLTPDGDIVTDREIDAALADTLLDGKLAEKLADARGDLAAFYAHEADRPEGVSSVEWHAGRWPFA